MTNASRSDQLYAALITSSLAVTGTITSGAAVAVIVHKRHLHNAFGYSCLSHAIGGLVVLLIFLTWVPFQLLATPETMPSFFNSRRLAYTIGQITIMFYYGAIYTHVLIGLNRYIAISVPFSYTKYFNDRRTVQWIALIWIISFLQSCAYQFNGCHYYFDRNMILFVYSDALCARIMSLYFEFYVNLTFVVFVVSLDILTFWKLNKMIKMMSGQQGGARERKAQEIRFFVQSVCSETALVLCFLCFWCVAIYATTTFSMFLLNMGAWETLHTVDGIIMVVFNHRICSCGKKQTVVAVVSAGLSGASSETRKRRLGARKRWMDLLQQKGPQSNKIQPSEKKYTKKNQNPTPSHDSHSSNF